jgi:NADH:ubiquinone oxidoreductase subunit 6 (subunit J)|tara:strand:+ start:1850 stop:2089 length:240 start_codon:yes stop_codon:yes gene_type:complete
MTAIIDGLKGVTLLVFIWLLIASITDLNWYSGINTFEGTTEAIGRELFSTYVFQFEIIAVLLLAAMVGAIYLAKEGTVK